MCVFALVLRAQAIPLEKKKVLVLITKQYLDGFSFGLTHFFEFLVADGRTK